MSPNINWDESSPADTDSAGQGDDAIRSLKTALRTALDSEHNWPASGGVDAGYHRYGSARAYYGTQSRVSSSGTDGRLMVTSDTSRIFHVGSTATSFMGGATVISAASFPGSLPQKSHWVMEFGRGETRGSVATNIDFPNSGFSGRPFLFVSEAFPGSGQDPLIFRVSLVDNNSFQVEAVDNLTGALSVGTFDWMSIGTRAL